MRAAPDASAEDVPQRVRDRTREHGDNRAPASAAPDVDRFGIGPRIAVAALGEPRPGGGR